MPGSSNVRRGLPFNIDVRGSVTFLHVTPHGALFPQKAILNAFSESRRLERLLALLPKSDANVRLDRGQHYEAAALMREAAEQRAETIIVRELRTAGLTEEELGERLRSDPLKGKIARAMRTETTVSLKWIARRLDLGSDSNVCHKINRSRHFYS